MQRSSHHGRGRAGGRGGACGSLGGACGGPMLAPHPRHRPRGEHPPLPREKERRAPPPPRGYRRLVNWDMDTQSVHLEQAPPENDTILSADLLSPITIDEYSASADQLILIPEKWIMDHEDTEEHIFTP